MCVILYLRTIYPVMAFIIETGIFSFYLMFRFGATFHRGAQQFETMRISACIALACACPKLLSISVQAALLLRCFPWVEETSIFYDM